MATLVEQEAGKFHLKLAEVFDNYVIATEEEAPHTQTQGLSQFNFQSQAYNEEINLRQDPFERGFATESTKKFHKKPTFHPKPSHDSDSEPELVPDPKPSRKSASNKPSSEPEPELQPELTKKKDVPRKRLADPHVNTMHTLSTPTPPPEEELVRIPKKSDKVAKKAAPVPKPQAPKPERSNFPKAQPLGNRGALPRRQLQPMSQDMLSQSQSFNESPEPKKPVLPRKREVGIKQKRVPSASESSSDEDKTVIPRKSRTKPSSRSLSNVPDKPTEETPAQKKQLSETTHFSGNFDGLPQSTKIGEMTRSELPKDRIIHDFNPNNVPQSTKICNESGRGEFNAKEAPQSTKISEKSMPSVIDAKSVPQSTKIDLRKNCSPLVPVGPVEAKLDIDLGREEACKIILRWKEVPGRLDKLMDVSLPEQLSELEARLRHENQQIKVQISSELQTLTGKMEEEFAQQMVRVTEQVQGVNANMENIFESQLKEIENEMSAFGEQNQEVKNEVHLLRGIVEKAAQSTVTNLEVIQKNLAEKLENVQRKCEENTSEITLVGKQIQNLTSLFETFLESQKTAAKSCYENGARSKESKKRKSSPFEELPLPDISNNIEGSNVPTENYEESTSYSPLSNTEQSTDDGKKNDETLSENPRKNSKKSNMNGLNKSKAPVTVAAPETAPVSSDSEIEDLFNENPTEQLLNKSSQGTGKTKASPETMDIASQPSNTSMALFGDEDDEATLTEEPATVIESQSTEAQNEEQSSIQAMSTPKRSSRNIGMPDVPISSIRPAHPDGHLQSTAMQGSYAPQPNDPLDGVIKMEPGVVPPSPIGGGTSGPFIIPSQSQSQHLPTRQMPRQSEGEIVLTLSKAERETKLMVKAFSSRFQNITFRNSMCRSITHVVAVDDATRRCNRTFKYIAGIAQGCWIVSLDWVKDSLERGFVLDEHHYEIIGDLDLDTSPNVPRMSRRHKSRRRMGKEKKGLIGDFVVRTCRPYDISLSKPNMHELLLNMGAKVVENEDELINDKDGRKGIIICHGGQNQDPAARPLSRTEALKDFSTQHNIPRVSRDWLLDCILNWSNLDVKSYILPND
ncbi:Oidioi.mRNA.OKI2018_I69.XSR.g14627.t1.cds [Oikopleura dioica]|uniref:Oidioi.mRNA.OKI2018_I69.XSR.g14627.t1.cds n=1 Tax=Oikopleura dioica TaxID=34765 RepID=A0ABN7SAD4_OIKDI|nr:Oidioi.mRNA.OKI2018_I69.XSR.g14627.t1.cds [Oikopleura dioica]